MMQAARSAAYARSVAQATNLSMAGAWAERAAASVALDSGDPAAAATPRTRLGRFSRSRR